MTTLFAFLGLASWVPVIEGQAPPPKLSVTLRDGRLAVEGASPGGSVAWFGISVVEAQDGVIERSQSTDVAGAGRDGTVLIEGRSAFPENSIWLIVDVETGEIATRMPAGSTAQRPGFRGKGIYKGPRGHDVLEEARRFGFVVVARAKAGAWSGVVGDGGASDEDRTANGMINVSVENLLPLGASPRPPLDLEPGDTLAFFDPYAFEFVVLRVQKS